MAMTFRINDQEQEAIRKKSIEINRKLVESGKAPLKDSELIHKVLLKAIRGIQLDKENNVILSVSEKN